MKHDYYQQQIIKIKQLIQNKHYLGAKEIVEDELKAPYIPTNYHQDFTKLFKQINYELFANSHIRKQPSPNAVHTFLNIINHPENFNFFDNDLQAILELINLRSQLPIIQKFCKNVNYNGVIKMIIIEELYKQQVNKEFIICNNTKTFPINPINYIPLSQQPIFANIINFAEHHFSAYSPQLVITLIDIVKFYFYFIYPEIPNKNEYKELVIAMFYELAKRFGEQINVKLVSVQFGVNVNIIKKYIKQFNLMVTN